MDQKRQDLRSSRQIENQKERDRIQEQNWNDGFGRYYSLFIDMVEEELVRL